MADALDAAILHTLQQLDDAPAATHFDVDDIAAVANLPRWAVASHLTRLAVAGYVHVDFQREAIARYRIAARGRARLLRTRFSPATADDARRALREDAARPDEEAAARTHVLVVDDDPGIRSVVSELLALEDYDVETAANGVEALQAIDREPPAVMLLDIHMPVLDGWDVAQTLRERHHWVPTVVMTAARQAPRWCADVRADACLGKPFGLEELLAAVGQALNSGGTAHAPA